MNNKLVTNLEIPNSVTTIGEWAFSDCSSLTSLTLGSSVSKIGDDSPSFDGCVGLKEIITLNPIPPSGLSEEFKEVWRTCTLKVPAGKSSIYERLSPWREFLVIEEIDDSSEPVNPDIKKFDLNGDGTVNTADVVTIYNFIINGN